VLVTKVMDFLPIDLAVYRALYPTLVHLVTHWIAGELLDTVYCVSQADQTQYNNVCNYMVQTFKPTEPTDGNWDAGVDPCYPN
jgi:hypothetical protein